MDVTNQGPPRTDAAETPPSATESPAPPAAESRPHRRDWVLIIARVLNAAVAIILIWALVRSHRGFINDDA